MVNADNLAFQERPNALDPVGVQDEMPDVFVRRMVNRVVRVVALKALIGHMLIGHHV